MSALQHRLSAVWFADIVGSEPGNRMTERDRYLATMVPVIETR